MTASAWTDDRIGRLQTLWIKGQTADQIARTLGDGITRSAVLRKIHRLGLSAGSTKGSAEASARPRPLTVARVRPLVAPPKVKRPAAAADPPAQEPGLATLQSVARHACRWPLGDPLMAGFTLCGNRVSRGAYCGPHAEIAYRAVRDTPQSLERLARLG